MALFKIHKGSASDLGKAGNITHAAHEGYAYFTPDDGKFYIDTATADTAVIGTNRIPLNAYQADLLGSADKGGPTKPFYLDGGLPVNGGGVSIEYIEGTQTAATNLWKGVTSDSSVYTGKVIAYKLPKAGNSSAATLTLTLADGTSTHTATLRRMGSNVTTHYPAGSVIFLVYDGSYWQTDGDYNTNDDYRVRMVARGTDKAYLLGTTTAPTSSNQNVTSVAETGVYFDTVAAKLVASTFKGSLEGNATSSSKVSQAATINAANDYRLLLSTSATNDSEVGALNKSSNLRYNPSTNLLSTGNMQLTGALDVTGNANFHNQTTADSLTAGSLLVTGNASFTQIPLSVTPNAASNDTSVATTAFVTNKVNASVTGVKGNNEGSYRTGNVNLTIANLIGSTAIGGTTQPIYYNGSAFVNTTYTLSANVPSGAVFTDTKNTAGSTDTSSKIFLIGATTQAANPQTYSDNEVFVTNGTLSTRNIAVSGNATLAGETSADSLTAGNLQVNGSANFVNTPTAPTLAAGTNTTQLATTAFVTQAVGAGFAANDAMVFKGVIGANQLITSLPTSGYSAGWTYRVGDAGTFAGEYCEVGDLIIAIKDGPSSGSTVIDLDWAKVERNIDGAVYIGHNVTTTDNAIARFDGTDGRIQNSGIIIDDNNNFTSPGSIILDNPNVTWTSGGTGDTEPSFQMVGKPSGTAQRIFKFKFSGSGTNVDVGWDWTGSLGSGAFFRNRDGSPSGSFGFFARNGSGTTQLVGWPAGNLVWGYSGSGTTTPILAVNHTAAGNGFNLWNSNVGYGSWLVGTKGKAGTATTYTNPNDETQTVTGYTGNTVGTSILTLGNSKSVGTNGSSYSSPGTAGNADNAQGYLRIYNSGTAYSETTSYGSWLYPSTGLAIPINKVGIMFRPDSSSYYTHISYQNGNNEALVAATTQAVTSFIFVNGEAQSNISSTRWRSLTPGLQIKNNSVRIGGLWDSGTSPDYKLRVDGNIGAAGNVISLTTNTYNLGSSTYRWKALYVGTADSYGNSTTPVYWNAGVPKAITSYGGVSAKATAANITTTTNAVAKYSDTTGTFANSGVTIDSENKVTATEFIGDLKANNIIPILSKSFVSGIYGQDGSGTHYYETVGSITPNDYNQMWLFHYIITIEVNGDTTYTYRSDVSFYGVRNTYAAYKVFNSFYSKYPIYQHMLLEGSSISYPHEFGYRLASSYGDTTVIKNITIDIIETRNCTAAFFDNPKAYSSAAPSNYTWRGFNATSNGLQETGDADTITRLYMSNTTITTGADMRLAGSALFGFDRENHAQTISLYSAGYTSTTTSMNTARVYNTAGFDWTKKLFYNASGNIAINTNSYIHVDESIAVIDFRYTDNCVATSAATTLGLERYKAVYIRGTLGTDGLFYLAPMEVTYNSATYKRVWTQVIPTTEDGYVYWFIGYPYYNGSYAGGYQLNFYLENKLYWYHNGRFEEYVPNATTADKVNHTLTFGNGTYVFDGSADVTVPVYTGSITQ